MIKNILKIKAYKIIAIAILAIFCIIIGYRFFSSFSIPDSSYNFSDKEGSRLYPNQPVIQKFIAKRNNLDQINLVLSNIKKSVKMELLNENCQQLIASKEIDSKSFNSGIYEYFSFLPIRDSESKTFCFKITYVPKENAQVKSKEYPRVASSAGLLFDGNKFVNPNDKETVNDRSLVMRPAYTNGSVIKDLNELNNRMSQYRPFFLKGIVLEVIFITFIILTVALVIILILL